MHFQGGQPYERTLEMADEVDEEKSEREVPLSTRVPQRIGEGMPVYDRDGAAIGIVDVVYLGGASDEAIERVLHPEKAPPAKHGDTEWSSFDEDNVPPETRARLMEHGYIRVKGADISGVKRYFGPEQIEGVVTLEVDDKLNDVVRLRVGRGELLND